MEQRIFFDTNILVYVFDDRIASKQQHARRLIGDAVTTGNGVISYQVVQEFLNVMTVKFEKSLSRDDLKTYLFKILWPMCAVLPTAELYAMALYLRAETGWRFYDSLIVGSALASDCHILYTEDLQHGRTFGQLEIRNPFR